jgi:hypothetical protein
MQDVFKRTLHKAKTHERRKMEMRKRKSAPKFISSIKVKIQLNCNLHKVLKPKETPDEVAVIFKLTFKVIENKHKHKTHGKGFKACSRGVSLVWIRRAIV